ncbi:MAG: site-specific integrase [Rikenellaceae bacterium]
MRRNSFAVLFFVNKSRLLKNGDAAIFVRITSNGSKAEASIKRSVPLRLWDQSKECSKGRDKVAAEINDCISSLRLKALSVYNKAKLSDKFYTARSIMDQVFGVDEDRITLLKAFRQHNEECRALIGSDYTATTVSRFDACCSILAIIIKERFKKDDILFDEIDPELIRQFELYLKTERGCSHNTVINYMKWFKKITNRALANGWMQKNPFALVKYKEKRVVKEVLTKEEIEMIMNKEFGCPRLECARDVFVFCCFTGLAYYDAYDLTQKHIVKDSNGDVWIRKARQKTDVMCNIPLMGIAQSIIDKHKDHFQVKKTGHLLPAYSNQKMNSYLKEIADRCDIDKRLTTHVARHTYATVVCLANGVSMENIAKMLGHTDTRMTQHYAKVMDASIKRDMAVVAEIFNSKAI